MLAAHKRWRTEHQRQQALWFKSCSATHKIWCNCGNWQDHILKPKPWSLQQGGADVSLAEGISFVTEDGDRKDGGDEGFTIVDGGPEQELSDNTNPEKPR